MTFFEATVDIVCEALYFNTEITSTIDFPIYFPKTHYRLNCGNARFGKRFLGDILTTTQSHSIYGSATIKNMAFADNIVLANKTQILGDVAGWNIDAIINDTIFVDEHNPIHLPGYYKLETLIVENLISVPNVDGVNIDEIVSKDNWKKTYDFDYSVRFGSALTAEKVYFGIAAAGVSKADFGRSWLLSDGDQTLRGSTNFFVLTCLGGIEADSAKINDKFVDVKAVWIDEDARMGTVVFENVFGNLLKAERVEGVGSSGDLVKRVSKDVTQNVGGRKNVLKNVNAEGSIVTYFISNVSLNHFCSLMNSNDYVKPSLILKGNFK